jgi:hypothetical protein
VTRRANGKRRAACYDFLVIPALIVGGLTAWYLGLRAGIVVAIAVAAALLLATFVPGMAITVYALVIAWAALLYFFGPKVAQAAGKQSILGGTVGQARSWLRKVIGNK